MEPVSASKQVKDETNLIQENLLGAIAKEPLKVAKKEENKQEKKSPEMIETKLESEADEQVDMSGMINRNFIEIERSFNHKLLMLIADVYFY